MTILPCLAPAGPVTGGINLGFGYLSSAELYDEGVDF